MSYVKWIKLAVSMFSNRKIRQIEKMPEGYALLIIWLKLLCLAGSINDKGRIYFTENLPYTEEMLATQFDMPISAIRLALKTFQMFNMLVISENGMLFLPSWEKYQNVEGMEKIREQNRLRKAKQRDRQKGMQLLPSRDSHVTVTQSHATDIDIEKEIDKEIDKETEGDKELDLEGDACVGKNTSSPPGKNKATKLLFGDFVRLTEEEHQKLIDKFGSEEAFSEGVEILDNYIGYKGADNYKSHYYAMRAWVFDKYVERHTAKPMFSNKNKATQEDLMSKLERMGINNDW